MPHPKVKLSDDSGNAVSVTGNRLDVNAYLAATPTIDIGDVSLLLGGTAASTNAGTMDAQTLRITLATDDTHFGAVGAAADADGVIHAQLYYMANTMGQVSSNTATNLLSLNNIESSTSLVVTVHNSTAGAYGNLAFGEAKTIDGSTLPNIVAEGDSIRIAASRAGIQYTHLTNDLGTYSAIVTDDGAQVATPGMVNVGGEYRASPVTYTDGDAAILQTNVNGALNIVGTVDLGSTDNTVLDNILTKNTEIDTVLDTIKVDTEAIETAVELLDNAIDGSEMQVDIVSSATLTVDGSGVTQPISGTITANLGTTDNAVLDAMVVDLAAIEVLLTGIDSDTDATKGYLSNLSGTQYVDDANWTDSTSKHLLVGGLYQSSMQSVTDGDVAPFQIDANGVLKVTGTVDLGSTDNTVLDNILTKNTEIDAVLDTIKVDTEAIETAVELIDDAIYADDDDFSLNSSKGIAIMGYAGQQSITDGDVGVITTNASGHVKTVTNLGTPDTFAMLDIDNAVEVLADTVGVISDCVEIFLQADESNSGYVIVGDDDVADNRGMKLNAGDTLILNVLDTRLISLWGSAANQNVRCMLSRA